MSELKAPNPNTLKDQTKNRTIIIGCDELSRLSIILGGLGQAKLMDLAVITVSKNEDLLRSIENNNPALVVLCFETNQQLLTEFYNSSIDKSFPIFCFTLDRGQDAIWWPPEVNIISYPFKRAVDESSIAKRIASILSLMHVETQAISSTFIPNNETASGVKNLSRFALELDQKNAILDRVKSEIETISSHASAEICDKLGSLLSLIKQTKSDQRYWKEFKNYFDELNPDFFNTLSQRHPTLTTKDLKYCSYLSMNLSNNEITRLMGINQESVRTHKYRLKKKMALSKEQNLEHYLIRVNSVGQKSA